MTAAYEEVEWNEPLSAADVRPGVVFHKPSPAGTVSQEFVEHLKAVGASARVVKGAAAAREN